jgi:muconate cycloisomerase
MDMRIEVNGQWTYGEACKNLSKLCRFNLSGIEEPLVSGNRDCLPQLKARFGIPIILDESICTFEDAYSAIQNGYCDIINIKISKCGGLINAQGIIHMAAMKNIACQIGTHVGESFILDSAGWHLALATTNLTYFEGCSFLLHNPSLTVDGTPPSRRKQPKNPGWGLAQRDIDELFSSSEHLFELCA